MSSVWNPDNVRDVAESVGIASLADNVVEELARDVDFRLAQVLEEALKFMRHGKRTTLSTQDVSNALKVLNVEPLYGYESTRPLRFGEASLGPGQPLYYVEDEEVDFEKLINAPLPKVPREITFTGMSPHPIEPLPPETSVSNVICHSSLAGRRGRATIDTPEPDCNQPRRPFAEGYKCEPAPSRSQWTGQRQCQATCQARAFERIPGAIREALRRTD
jgi:histone H3/H4